MKAKRIVDLSHTVIPGEEEYRLEVDTRFTDQWPQFAQYRRVDDAWYLISEVTMNTHVGTHVELPYHHCREGQDASTFPVDGLVGDAAIVDISAYGHNARIELEGLRQCVGDRLRPGDIAFFYTGFDRYYRTPRQHDRPWFTTEAIGWLAEEVKIKMMGVDTSGIEVRNADGSPSIGQPNHERLLCAGIPLVEYLANLQEFLDRRFTAFVLPVKVARLEAFPVRVVGIEWEEGEE